MEDIKINREYKDRMFKLVFREKKDLLELYNAINSTSYTNEEEIEINTIEDALYLNMHNDISYIITSVLNLYEQQSSYNPNIPIRGLIYFASLYKKIIKDEARLYSTSLLKLPIPQFIVFYNGTKDFPDNKLLKLTDAFTLPEWAYDKNVEEISALQCTARVVNINVGHNIKLMQSCKKLQDYSTFIGYVRQYTKDYTYDDEDTSSAIRKAINIAIDRCINEDVLKEILVNRRAEVLEIMFTEYDMEKHMKVVRKDGYNEGHDDGFSEGRDVGYAEGRDIERAQIIISMTKQGKSPEEISTLTGIDIDTVKKIYEKLN